MSLIKATRQITNRITNRILSPITSRIVGSGIGGSVASIIASARNALNIHPEQQVGATYLAQKTPTIAGVVADETPTRKDRTRLSCRASDFDGINQRFFGGNTSTGKTALSVSAWIRPTGASSRVVIAEDDASTSRSFLIYIDASNKLKIIIWNENGTKAIQVESVDAFTDSEWHHIGFTLNCATDTFLMYANGKVIDVIPIGAQSAIASINDSTQSIEVGSNGGGAAYFEGQIQQPLIYEGVWSAAQIRDLYLQQYDDIPITYGWFLNGDTASGLTSSSPALAASNSPDLYEDDAIGGGDWLNEKGWNGAAEFNGTSSWIELQSQPIDTTGDFKLSMFIKPATNGIENFLGYSATEGNCFAYMFAGGNSINLRINNINESFTFPQTTAEMREGGDLIIERVSGTTTIIYQGVTSPETLVESGLFHIETIGRERTAYFEGLIRNFVYEESGVALVNLPLFADANDISGNGDDGTDTDVTYVPIPKRWNEELDSAGQPAANSESFGVARRDGQLADGACLEFTGTEYATNANLVGTETVTSSGGTSTPTISAGRIDFTAGTCWGLTLSNGSIYPLGEGAGTAAYDVVNDEPLVLVNSPTWGNQSQYFWNENQGCSLYEHATSPDILVPFGSDGLALTITPPSGYTKTSDNPAGPWLYEGLGSTYVNFDVVPNANQWLEQRWTDASFNGTSSYLYILNTGTTIFQFDDVWEYKSLLFTSVSGVQGIATVGNATEGFNLTGGTSIQTNFGAGYQNINVGYTRNEENDLTVSMDGSGTTLTLSNINDTNGLTENSRVAAFTQVGKASVVIGLKAGSYWNGEMRQLKYTHEGTVYFDTPMLGCSLDLSLQVNHGTDNNITYNRLTDVSYQAGDTVEQPFSVNDATAGRVSELIQFTFPKV